MNALFLKIVNMSIATSWLILAVLILWFALKKAPKWVSVLLWGIVAVRLICPFSIESVLSLIPSTETIPLDIEMDWTPAIHSGVGVVNRVINPVIAASFTPAPLSSANPLQIWIPLAWLLWIFGMVAMLLYTAISYGCLRRKFHTAVRYKDNIFQSENVSTPFVFGILRPRIYLPLEMDGQELEYIIAHEQAHIRRKDHWWKPLGFLLLTIHWFNPLLWLAYVLLCRDIELACDERVIKDLGCEQRADYTQALLDRSVGHRIIGACPLAFGEVGVKERVKSVMRYKKPAFWVIVLAIVICAVVAVCFLTDPPAEPFDIGEQAEALSLDDVIILSQRGHDLTWSDFDAYAYHETGSGLYIRVYEINEVFELWIGGTEPDSDPWYIYLALADDMDTRIDIRDGGVAEFISQHDSSKAETWDLIPMVMVNGTLYLDTGRESTLEGRCGVMDGEITSQVDGSEKPEVDDQSNFGTGYGYQYGATEGTIELYMNGKWRIFATEEVREEIQFRTELAPAVTHYPVHKALYEPTPVELIEEKYDKEEFVISKLHYKNIDSEWVCGEYTYQYRLEIFGRMHNAAKNTTYIVLSNRLDITFDQTWKASGLSSNMADYFDPADAVIVGSKSSSL